VPTILAEHQPTIEALCRRYHVRRLDAFGSVLRDDFDPEHSDVDLLVEYDPAYGTPSLKEYFGFRDALSELLGRPVDLVMTGAVRNPIIKADIDATRSPIYAA
jgi:predicted nucleotidyltransferase